MLSGQLTALPLAQGPIILAGLLVIVLPVGICMLSSLIYFLVAWNGEKVSPGRKTLALVWSFLAPILMGIPAAVLMLRNEFMVEGSLLLMLLLIQPFLICRLVLRFSIKRSLLSIPCIYGPLALLLLRLLWSFGRMSDGALF